MEFEDLYPTLGITVLLERLREYIFFYEKKGYIVEQNGKFMEQSSTLVKVSHLISDRERIHIKTVVAYSPLLFGVVGLKVLVALL